MSFDWRDLPVYLIRLVNGDTFLCRTHDEDEKRESPLFGHYVLCLRPTVVTTLSGLPKYAFSPYEPAGKHQQSSGDTRLQIPVTSILYMIMPEDQLEHDYTQWIEEDHIKKYGSNAPWSVA